MEQHLMTFDSNDFIDAVIDAVIPVIIPEIVGDLVKKNDNGGVRRVNSFAIDRSVSFPSIFQCYYETKQGS